MKADQIERGKLYVMPNGGPNRNKPTLYVGLGPKKVMTSHPDFVEEATIKGDADLSRWIEVDPDIIASAVTQVGEGND